MSDARGYAAARARVEEYLRQRRLQTTRYAAIHGLFIDPDAAMADLLEDDLQALLDGPPPEPQPPIPFNMVAMDVAKAWVLIPRGGYEASVKRTLRGEWPQLWHALQALGQYDGHTEYRPE